MTNRFNLSLVLPCYNEAPNVEETVQRCLAALQSCTDKYEIVVVDDGSTDGSGAIADRLQEKFSAIRVIHNPINLGVGTSLLIGMQAATGELVLHDAMDYPFDLDDLRMILPLFPEWDVVTVVRTDRSAHSAYRKLTSAVNYWLLRLLFGVKLGDLNFVQVYKREVLKSFSVKARSPAFVLPECLIRAGDEGFRITQVRAPFHRRRKGRANYGRPRDILWTLADMFSFWLERMRSPDRKARNRAGVESAKRNRAS